MQGADKAVADFALEDLLTKEELQNVPQTVSSRHWAGSSQFTFSPDGKAINIKVMGGRAFKIDLATGKIVK